MLQDQNEVNETDQKKINLIRSYVIPNTKEDLFEFLVLASSNINFIIQSQFIYSERMLFTILSKSQ